MTTVSSHHIALIPSLGFLMHKLEVKAALRGEKKKNGCNLLSGITTVPN